MPAFSILLPSWSSLALWLWPELSTNESYSEMHVVLMGNIQEYGLGFINFYSLEFNSMIFTRVAICCFYCCLSR